MEKKTAWVVRYFVGDEMAKRAFENEEDAYLAEELLRKEKYEMFGVKQELADEADVYATFEQFAG